MKKILFKKSTQTAALNYLKNDQYFSRDNKRFFNVEETRIYEFENKALLILEKQGAFLSGGRKHNVLKIVAQNKHAITLTSGFTPEIDGEKLLYNLREFFKTGLGYFENKVVHNLASISKSDDFRNTLLFESTDSSGFYLSLDDLKIILHK